MENSDNIIVSIAEFAARENNVSKETLYIFSLLCHATRDAVQWRINLLRKSKDIYDKWAPRFALKLKTYLQEKRIKHPIKYSGKAMRVATVRDMNYNMYGLSPLDLSAPMFSAEQLAKTKFAFTNICFLTNFATDLLVSVFIADQCIYTAVIDAERFVDLGENTEDRLLKWGERDREDANSPPGRYFIDFELPLALNPIVVGESTLRLSDFHILIAPKLIPENFSPPHFIGAGFSHAFIHFNTVAKSAYKWPNYALAFDESLGNKHALHASFLREIDDPQIVQDDAFDKWLAQKI